MSETVYMVGASSDGWFDVASVAVQAICTLVLVVLNAVYLSAIYKHRNEDRALIHEDRLAKRREYEYGVREVINEPKTNSRPWTRIQDCRVFLSTAYDSNRLAFHALGASKKVLEHLASAYSEGVTWNEHFNAARDATDSSRRAKRNNTVQETHPRVTIAITAVLKEIREDPALGFAKEDALAKCGQGTSAAEPTA